MMFFIFNFDSFDDWLNRNLELSMALSSSNTTLPRTLVVVLAMAAVAVVLNSALATTNGSSDLLTNFARQV